MSIMMDLAASFGGVIGWLMLFLLPGAWVTFGLKLSGFHFWMRLLIGTSIAPFVVFLQFYALRLLGFSFETVVYLLLILNLPALYLINKRRSEISVPNYQTIFGMIIVILIPLLLLLPQILNSHIRIFSGHTWMQSDIIYLLANGNLWLEEPEIAGLRLGYPWAAHLFQAVLSYLLNSPPASSYIWTNIASFISIYGFSAYTIKELGGNRFSQVTGFLWLVFGLNFVGYVLFTMLPKVIAGTFWETGEWKFVWIGGDYRITPWMLKYFFFEQGILGSAVLCAIIYLLIKKSAFELTTDNLILLGLLLCALNFAYPVYFPTAFILVCASVLTLLLNRAKPENRDYLLQCFKLGAVLLASTALTYGYVKFVTVDRVAKSMILPTFTLQFAKHLILKSASSVVVLALFLGAIGFAINRCWKDYRNQTIILLIGAFGSVLMFILVEIPYPWNEYKFFLTTALCVAPFPAIALQPYLERLGKKAIYVFVIISFILVSPTAHKFYIYFPWIPPGHLPVIDASNFNMKLTKNEPFSELCEVIRQKTSLDTILVIEKSELHFPTLTQRVLYAPPEHDRPFPGISFPPGTLLKATKGYDKKIIDDRRAIVRELFHSTDINQRTLALEQILQLKRPTAVIFNLLENADLRNFLSADNRNIPLFEDSNWGVWLISPQ